MKKIASLIAITFLTFSMVSAQTGKNKFPARQSEQNEINADKKLEKEIQQKQLMAKPERLEEQSVNKTEGSKNRAATSGKKPKNSNKSCLHKKKS